MTTATYWAMTINNPDDNDYAIVRQGYPDYIRSIIHTTETGKDGTPHIQAWFKLQKQQRMSFVKKLFPRAHFTPLTQAEHELNTRRYVQKEDETTNGAHIQTHNEPLPDAVKLLEKYCERYCNHVTDEMDKLTTNTIRQEEFWRKNIEDVHAVRRYILQAEKDDVFLKPAIAKLLVSPMYSKIKKEYLPQILSHVIHKSPDADDHAFQRNEDTGDEQTESSAGLEAAEQRWQEEDSDGECPTEASDSKSDCWGE